MDNWPFMYQPLMSINGNFLIKGHGKKSRVFMDIEGLQLNSLRTKCPAFLPNFQKNFFFPPEYLPNGMNYIIEWILKVKAFL